MGRILGVRVAVRVSWLVALALLGLFLYGGFAAHGLDRAAAFVAAAVTGGGLLGSVLLHELSHALLARRAGIEVIGISLNLVGGVTLMHRGPEQPAQEFAIALVGPATNVLIAGLLTAVAALFDGLGAELTRDLAWFNVLLAGFNLVPVHPLDGGTLVRAALWGWLGHRVRAARVAAAVGQVLGGLILTAGLVHAFVGTSVAGIWLAIVGALLLRTAGQGVRRTEVRERLRDVSVRVAARPVGWTGAPGWTLSRVVASVAGHGQTGLVVDESGAVLGAFGPDELADVSSSTWDASTLGEHMRPVAGSVPIDDRVLDVVERFGELRGGAVVALEAGIPTAVLTRADVTAALEVEPVP